MTTFNRDPTTNQILHCWDNPLNGKRVTVLDVVNDPVNFTYAASTWVPYPTLEYGGRVIFGINVIIGGTNALQPAAGYADFSAGPIYQTAELFNYGVNRLELDATLVKSTTAEVSWTRIGQWLPWMQMGAAPGNLMYQARGFKVRNFDAVPADLRDYVRANYPTFEHAPTVFTAPNESSWTTSKRSTTPASIR